MQLLLNFTRATRTGNWNLHLATLKAFLPWFFAYDRLNYASYASVYYCEMIVPALTNVCRQEAGIIDDTSPAHKETKKARLQKDEADVQCLASTLENWCNPFSASSDGELVCLSSGQAAGDTLQADLSQAFTQGMAACQKFVEDRLVKKTTPFYDKVTKMGLLTFSSKAMHQANCENINKGSCSEGRQSTVF